MRKALSITLSVISGIIIGVVALLLIAALLLNVGSVQNFAVRKATEWASKKTGTTVSIGHIRIRGFSRVALSDIYVEDQSGDTLIYARDMSARLNLGVIRNRIEVDDVKLDEGKIYLYTGEDGVMNLSKLLAAFSSGTTKKGGGKLYFPDIAVSNSVLKFGRWVPDSLKHRGGGVDFADMELRNLDLGIRNLVVGNEIMAELYAMSFTEKSGLQVEQFEMGRFAMGEGSVDVKDMRLRTPDSDINLPLLTLRGNSWADFSDLVHKVAIKANLADSRVGMRTAGYFVPSLPAALADATISDVALEVEGTVNDISGSISNLTYDDTSLLADFSVQNITDGMENATLSFDLRSLSTTGAAIARITNMLSETNTAGKDLAVARPDTVYKGTAAMLANLGEVHLSAKADGRMSNLNIIGALATAIGNAGFSGIAGINDSREIALEGDLSVSDFNAGSLTGNKMLGPLSLTLHADGTIKDKSPDMRVNANVSHIYLNGYNYTNLSFRGSIKDKVVNGNFAANGAALKLDVSGKADLGSQTPAYDLDVNLAHADLVAMKLAGKDSVALVSAKITARGSGTTLDDLNGTLKVADLTYITARDTLRADRIEITGKNSQANKMLALDSEFITAEFYSTMSYRDLYDSFNTIVLDYAPSLKSSATRMGPHPAPASYSDNDISTLKVDILDLDRITHIFAPTLDIAQNSGVEVELNPYTERFSARARFDFIEYGNYLATKLDLAADNRNAADSLEIKFSTSEILIPGATIPEVSLVANIKDDNIQFHSDLSNSQTQVSAVIDARAALGRNQRGELTVSGKIYPSTLTAIDNAWNVSSSDIFYSKERVDISDFAIRNSSQALLVDGTLSSSRADTLHVRLTDVDLGILSSMLGSSGLIPHGRLNGYADIVSAMKNPLIEADIIAENIGMNNQQMPPLHITSQWGVGEEKARVLLANLATGERMVEGTYSPSTGDYEANVNISGLPLALATPFIGDLASDISGEADIDLDVSGGRDKKKPLLNGSLSIDSLKATVGFTKAAYTVPKMSIGVDNDLVTIPSTAIIDSEGGMAELEARLDISNFSSPSYDVKMVMDKIVAVNTTIRESQSFYGRVYASGNVHLTGNKMGVNVDAVVSTDDGSTVHVPLNSSQSVSSTDFITYLPKERPIDSLTNLDRRINIFRREQQQRNSASKGKLNMNIAAALTITPGTTLRIEIDPVKNDVLELRGNASLNATINPGTKDMNIFGTYGITDGRYLFNYENIISNKLFVIQPDSYIQFIGNPMESNLDIKAIHSLRASLAPLVSSGMLDSEQYGRGRIPVDCIIDISGRLSAPDIAFDVVARTTDPNLQTTLNSMFAAQDIKMQQFLWLIALGNFTSETINTTGLSGTAIGFDFLANQLNTVLSTVTGDNTTINVQYRQSDAYNSEEIDFGFTRELLGGRLVFEYEGNYDTGYSAYKDTPLSNNLSLTGLLNRSGNLRGKLFTRSVDRFDDNLVVQETGLGLYYREDFDRFSEVIDKIKARLAGRRKKE